MGCAAFLTSPPLGSGLWCGAAVSSSVVLLLLFSWVVVRSPSPCGWRCFLSSRHFWVSMFILLVVLPSSLPPTEKKERKKLEKTGETN